MQVAHQAFQPIFQHVRIDLGGGNVGVTEQGLNDAQIRTILQKMACEGVPQHVRAHPARSQAGGLGERLELAGEVQTRDVAVLAEEHYSVAAKALAACPRQAMRPAAVMLHIYRALLHELLLRGWKRLDEPVRVSPPRKLALLLRHGLAGR